MASCRETNSVAFSHAVSQALREKEAAHRVPLNQHAGRRSPPHPAALAGSSTDSSGDMQRERGESSGSRISRHEALGSSVASSSARSAQAGLRNRRDAGAGGGGAVALVGFTKPGAPTWASSHPPSTTILPWPLLFLAT